MSELTSTAVLLFACLVAYAFVLACLALVNRSRR